MCKEAINLASQFTLSTEAYSSSVQPALSTHHTIHIMWLDTRAGVKHARLTQIKHEMTLRTCIQLMPCHPPSSARASPSLFKTALIALLLTTHLYWVMFLGLVQVQLRTEGLCTPSSTQLGFELMTSRPWQYILCHWDACSNHLAISDCTLLWLFMFQSPVLSFSLWVVILRTPPHLCWVLESDEHTNIKPKH